MPPPIDNFANVPAELRALPRRWACWRQIGKDKPPINATVSYRGKHIFAKCNDPATWADFETALRYWEEHLRDGPAPAGLSLAFAGDGIVGIDIDDCVNAKGAISPKAASIIRRIGSYTEFSPSQTGIRIIAHGPLLANRKKGDVEFYSTAKFLSITGRRINNFGASDRVEERSEVLPKWHTEVFGDGTAHTPTKGNTNGHLVLNTAPNIDENRLADLFRRKPKARALWELDEVAPSQSEADLALANLAVNAGWDDQSVCDLLVVFRQLSSAEHPKLLGYYERTIRKAHDRDGRQAPRPGPTRPTKENPSAPADTPKADESPTPAPLLYQPFPADALPEPLAAFVRQGAAALGCDASYFALPVLTVAASMIGNARAIRLKRDWTEPAVIWSAIIGDSGTLKSPALRLAVAPVYQLQRELLAAYKAAMVDYRSAKAKHEAAVKKAKKEGKALDDVLPDPPTPGRILTGDITIEKLGQLLADNPRGLLVSRDELRNWFHSFNRYKRGMDSDLPAWLEFFRAESVIIDRKSGDRPTLFIPRAAVSVCGGIQSGTIARALTEEAFEAGLAARLLLAMPPKQPKEWREVEIEMQVQDRYESLLRKLFAIKLDTDKKGEPEPFVLKLTKEAKASWVDFYTEWAAKQADAEGEQAACLSKLEAYAARFALIHHIVSRVDAGDDDCDPVERESIEAGATLARWFASEAERVYAVCRSSDDERHMRRLVEYIQSKGGKMTARCLHLANRSRYSSPEAAEAVLESLVKAGLGKWIMTGEGGRPSRQFSLGVAT